MARVKTKDYENLSAANIRKVIDLLNPEEGKPISKKEACDILNISYNTSRLDKIIETFQEREEYTKKRKAANRGKPATDVEIADIAKAYLQGEAINTIAKDIYRSAGFVKNVIDTVGIPQKPRSAEERQLPAVLPDECCAESFENGEIVWSALHHAPARIKYEVSVNHQAEKEGFSDLNYEKKYGSKCYAIYVMEDMKQDGDFWIRGVDDGGYSAYALAFDLGKLEHLKKYNVDLDKL